MTQFLSGLRSRRACLGEAVIGNYPRTLASEQSSLLRDKLGGGERHHAFPFRLVTNRRSTDSRSVKTQTSVHVHKLIQAQEDLAELGQRLVGVRDGVASREGALGVDEGEHLCSFCFRSGSREGDAVGVID